MQIFNRFGRATDGISLVIDERELVSTWRRRSPHAYRVSVECRAALEAKITSLACSEAPTGAGCWTPSRTSPRLSDETIRKSLERDSSNPG